MAAVDGSHRHAHAHAHAHAHRRAANEHRHHLLRLSPLHLPTISEERLSRSSLSLSLSHPPSPSLSHRRARKPEWPWDSDDEEYIENAPLHTDAHERLGWEIAEYRERLHLGTSADEDEDEDADEALDQACDLAYASSVGRSTPGGRGTPTIRITPPPASTPPPTHRRDHTPRAIGGDRPVPVRPVTPLDLGASALERADATLARLAHHPSPPVIHPTPLLWSRLDSPSTPAASAPSLPPCPSPSSGSTHSLTPSQSVSSGRSPWHFLPALLYGAPSPSRSPAPAPAPSPFEWDSPSPRFSPAPAFGEWRDWGEGAGSAPAPPPMHVISPFSPRFTEDLAPPSMGRSARASPEIQLRDPPSPLRPRFSDPEDWYSAHSGSFGVDVQRRSVDVQAIAEWRLDVFEEGGGWSAGVGEARGDAGAGAGAHGASSARRASSPGRPVGISERGQQSREG
ncbi:hypothetical protein CC85DRAFT_327347 [Cutaneotrichosporon oleaginosum]|uniref:Uncharacterized protein n=1 Tax=Cutaneotrichosporon oleaginosum TaxID=879819 RepID=A0A0J0XQP3_9TREE|nr:uncharacterized protein CC85DRAFT_327347 [Cutaneotrichosporon oleaginosum]KLT43403.1 hypothetical protein CC85DRAFT_327347 [Cutaneotrichosporon oleaginosum]TXT05383.1 hypothetical protein COLE_06703 [Cutaneotrichosporon oleaginosum]